MNNFLKTAGFIICICFCLTSCSNETDKIQTLKGEVKGLGNGPVVLCAGNYGKRLDTVQAVDSKFEFKHNLNIKDPRAYTLDLPENNIIENSRLVFFIDSKNIEIKGEIVGNDNFNQFKIESIVGSPITNELIELRSNPKVKLYNEEMSAAYEKKNQVEERIYNESNIEAYAELNKIEQLIDSIRIAIYKSTIKGVSGRNKQIALLYMIHSQCVSASASLLKGIVNEFPDEISNTYYVQDFKRRIKAKEKIAIGSSFPDVMFSDSDNKEVNLKDLVGRGKYTLIDVWSTSCGPCIREFPHLKKAYKEYHEKGFDIISVNYDGKTEKWKKILNKYQLPYRHLIDYKNQAEEVFEIGTAYGVPFLLLVSPDRKILAINQGLRGEMLDKTLIKYLDK